MSRPLVSVCIPTRNRASLLREALSSALAQSYCPVEIIVADNASTDDTSRVVEDVMKRDARVRYIRHACDIGMAANWRAAVEASKGQFFSILNDDDLYSPDFVRQMADILVRHPKVDWAFGNHLVIDPNGRENVAASHRHAQMSGRDKLREGLITDIPSVVFINGSCSIQSCLFRRVSVDRLGGVNGNAGTAVDWDLFLRLCANPSSQAYFVKRNVAYYRLHESQHTLGHGGSVNSINNLLSLVSALRSVKFENHSAAERVRRIRLGGVAARIARLGPRTDAHLYFRDIWRIFPWNPRRFGSASLATSYAVVGWLSTRRQNIGGSQKCL